jgi:hypothetical protein
VSLQVWYDASDKSSITQSGGNISQWNDKSGNGRHLIQSNETKKPSYEAQGIMALQEGLNAYFGNSALKVDGIMGPKTQAMLKGYEEDFANKAGLAGRQAPVEAVVAQQASVQQPSFLGMKLDQQATDDAWARWRSNDAPEGFIPSAVYK